ncbi:MAG: DUF2019 domain-containing protein [Solirubrobacteraceae bacterium]
MSSGELEDDRVREYAYAAVAHRRATKAGDSGAANEAHDRVAAIYRQLREQDSRSVLLPLLEHPDAGVRGWAAAHALEFAPTNGERVLEELAASEAGIDGFTAEQTLAVWRDGEEVVPFAVELRGGDR